MNILSLKTLAKLKCTKCECYLSRAPIYLKENGASICGRCSTPEETETEKLYHNVPLEDLLKTYEFPCMYKGEGCDEQLPFTDMEQHEKTCRFRPVKCLMSSSGSCDWLGKEDKLYDHCVDKHSTQVVHRYPYVFQHDVTTTSFQTYIAKLYEILFLIQVKVCLTTHKIYHSVQWIGGHLKSNQPKFTLTINRGNEKLTKEGYIVPYNQKTTDTDMSIGCSINSLLEFLGDLDNTVFTIDFTSIGNCVKCGLNKTVLNENKYCDKCDENKYKACKNASKGCDFSDNASNVLYVHERSLCLYNNVKNKCLYCANYVENSSTDSLITHIKTLHGPDWIHQENEYFWNFFPIVYSECNNWISNVINSRYGKFIFICDLKTRKIRMLSVESANNLPSGLKCTMRFKTIENDEDIIEKTFRNYEDVVELTDSNYNEFYVKVSFSNE